MAESERTDYRSLGEILRDARTAQGKSVRDLAELTKISPHAIAALEADDIDQLAGPVYARSFTRNLAESLGLDAEFLLTKLALAAPSAPARSELPTPELPKTNQRVVPKTELPKSEDSKDASTWHIEQVRVTRVHAPTGPRVDRRVIGAAVLVVVLGAVLWLLIPRLRGGAERIGSSPDSPDPSAQNAAAGGESLALDLPPAESPQEQAQELAASGEEIVPASAIRPTRGPATSDPAGPQVPPARTPPATADTVPGDERRDTQPVQNDTPPPPAEQQQPPRPEETVRPPDDSRGLASIERPSGEDPTHTARLTLLLRAERRVEIWAAADGRQRRRRILRPGEQWTLEATDHFSLELEDARAVAVFVDGVRRDPPQGLSGEWILFPNDAPR